ncbi:hypothetical protein Tco_0347437 [Tanacetum coccineum]
MDLKWQVAMISMRLKKFYKKIGRKLQFDAKEPVGFDKTKVDASIVTRQGTLLESADQKGIKISEGEMQRTLDIKQKTMGGDLENRRNLKLCHLGSDTEVTSCLKECVESYAKLKKLYDEQREKLGDASIEIKAYTLALAKDCKSDSDDEYVVQPSKEHETPSFAFVNTVKHVKTPRETIKEQNTCNQRCYSKGTGQGENRPVWNNVQRLNHQNKFAPIAVLIRTGRFPVNTARHNFNSQALSTSAARKANSVRSIVNDVKPRPIFNKTHSPIRRLFNRTTTTKTDFSNQKVNTPRDKAVSVVGGIRETAVKTSDDPQQTLKAKWQGMIRNLDAKKQFLMYPRFVQVFLNNQLSNLPAPLDNLPIPVLTKKVFTNMAKQGLHFSGHVTPLFPKILAQAVVDEGEGSTQPTEPQPTPFPTQPSIGDQPPVTESSYRPDTTQYPRVNLEGTDGSQGDHVQIPHNSPLSGGHISDRSEGGLNLDELLVLCTNLSNRVLALETSKDAQAVEILKLKTRIKKLENKCKPSISHHRAWLRSVSRLSRAKKLGTKESVSKQGWKNAKPRLTLDAFDDLDVDLAHGMDYMETKESVNEGRQSNETEELNLDVDTKIITEDNGSGEKGGNIISTARPEVDTARPDIDTARLEVHTTNAPVSTTGVTISTDDPEVSAVELKTPPTTTSIFDDEDITMAQTLIKMKEEKAKEKGVAFKDVEDSSRPARSVLTLKPLPSIDPKDKGNELAHKLHEEELAEIARIQEEKEAQEEASRVAIMEMFDEVQAGIDADALFVAKLQQEEREEYTIKERAKFLAETIDAQRKFRAVQRAAKIRSRPPTKYQLRNLMMTYLKNMGGYKHS